MCILLIVFAWLYWQGTLRPLLRDFALGAVALQVGYFIYVMGSFVVADREKLPWELRVD